MCEFAVVLMFLFCFSLVLCYVFSCVSCNAVYSSCHDNDDDVRWGMNPSTVIVYCSLTNSYSHPQG